MRIEDYKAGDEQAILQLFKLSFRTEMTLAYWQWRFRNNPSGQVMIKLMWDGDILAGHYAVSPVKLLIEGEEVLSALSMTTMTHPDYGGRGIFTTLAEALYQDISIRSGVVSVWGFPNSNSHYGFIKNLHWKNIGLLPNLSADLSKMRLNDASHPIQQVTEFDEKHFAAFSQLNQFNISTFRNPLYLNWRYLQNPVNHYDIFEHRADNISHFAVCKVYQPQGKPVEVDVVELQFPADTTLLQSLLNSIKERYKIENTGRINLWLPLNDPKHILLERLGFVYGAPVTYMGCRSLIDQPGINHLQNWNISMGDSDIY